jgi:methylase of polypeptide subunit release factors
MATTEVDCTPLFDRIGPRDWTRERILLGVTEHTYFPSGEPETGWLPKVSRAFGLLARPSLNGRIHRDTVCIIGCGPAVDGILAVEVLRPRRLILTDLHEDVVSTARENVARNCVDKAATEVEGYVSDLCEILVRKAIKVDLIYENLPNLPALDGFNVAEGAMSASFFSVPGAERNTVPPEYDRHMLGLHYRCLRQARECLNPGGEMVSCIGARIPQSLVSQMFCDLGYSPTFLVVDMVEQFEAEKVLAEYAQIEREGGLQFTFYDLNEGRDHLNELAGRGAPLDKLADEMATLGIAFNAQTAARRHAMGQHVAVVGMVIKGAMI